MDDVDLLAELLEEGDEAPKPRHVVQVGPVRRYDNMDKYCASRGCSSPTMQTLDGIPYCTVHLINYMNEMLLKAAGLHWIIEECTCKAGKYTAHATHTSDCATFSRLVKGDV